MNDNILVLDGLSAGQKARLTRLAKGLRQIDVASQANVQPIDITRLENGRYVLPTRLKRILSVLGLLDGGPKVGNSTVQATPGKPLCNFRLTTVKYGTKAAGPDSFILGLIKKALKTPAPVTLRKGVRQ